MPYGAPTRIDTIDYSSSKGTITPEAREKEKGKDDRHRQSVLNHLTFGLAKDMYSATPETSSTPSSFR